MILKFYDRDKLTTLIHADPKTKTVTVENFSDDFLSCAFGNNPNPTWDDLMQTLEDHCVPRTRGHIGLYLKTLGLDHYDPIEIVRKTKGRMAENHQHIEIMDA